VLEREQNENKGGRLEDPEREQSHRVRNKKLKQPGHHHRNQKRSECNQVGRQDKILMQVKNEQTYRNQGNRGVNKAARQKQTEPVTEIINRFDQELADVAVLDVRRDLPIVFGDRRKRVDDGHQQIIGNHLGQGVLRDFRVRLLAIINGPPQ